MVHRQYSTLCVGDIVICEWQHGNNIRTNTILCVGYLPRNGCISPERYVNIGYDNTPGTSKYCYDEHVYGRQVDAFGTQYKTNVNTTD